VIERRHCAADQEGDLPRTTEGLWPSPERRLWPPPP
jgi:hypothetical protein